jgi:hypothetical protein
MDLQITPPEAERNHSFHLDATPDIFEPAFKGFSNNPGGAIRKLMAERRGEVADAYHHPELGEIAFVYGNNSLGLAHIAAKRGRAFVDRIPEILRSGRVVRDAHGLNRAYVVTGDSPARVVVLRLDWNGKEKTWVITSFVDENGKFAGTEKTSNTLDTSAPMPAERVCVPDATEQTPPMKISENGEAVNDAADDVLKPKSMAFAVFPDQGIGPAAVDVAPNGLDATNALVSAALPDECALDSVGIPIDQHMDVVRKLLSALTGERGYALDSLHYAASLSRLSGR